MGDSAALFIDPATGSCSTLTEDHRLANPRERERLAALGIQVTPVSTIGLCLCVCVCVCAPGAASASQPQREGAAGGPGHPGHAGKCCMAAGYACVCVLGGMCSMRARAYTRMCVGKGKGHWLAHLRAHTAPHRTTPACTPHPGTPPRAGDAAAVWTQPSSWPGGQVPQKGGSGWVISCIFDQIQSLNRNVEGRFLEWGQVPQEGGPWWVAALSPAVITRFPSNSSMHCGPGRLFEGPPDSLKIFFHSGGPWRGKSLKKEAWEPFDPLLGTKGCGDPLG